MRGERRPAVRVAVVGAGIGGLAAAIGLQRAGARVTVLEQAEQLRPVGSGLSLFGNGLTALGALGLADAVESLASPVAHLLKAGQRRPDGRWLARTPSDALTRLAVVHRADLHRVLEGALRPGTLRLGARVVDVAAAGDEVRLEAAGEGGTERFDLVVAADGIRSRVRAGWPGDPGLRYSGYTAWRGVTERPVDLLGAAGETWGRGLRFGVAPLADGRVYWFGVASVPEGAGTGDEDGAVTRLFAGWHAPIADLLAATPAATVVRHDVFDLARPLATFRRGRCVLLGDAAHAMTPDLGQGANQALEDAATLTRLLADPAAADPPPAGVLDAALDRYDRLRRPRTQQVARRAHAVGAVAQAGGVAGALRDAVLRLVPERALRRQLTELQAWQPPAAGPGPAAPC
jgi:2-polyprenyl-6-methoxyphenol hydroxylase-like FAD-dependent oxidoreductase